MLSISVLLAVAGMLGLVSAQTPITTTSSEPATGTTSSEAVMTTSSVVMTSSAGGFIPSSASGSNYPYTVAAGSVPTPTAQAWCDGQRAACPMICGNRVQANRCFEDSLTYDCQCSSGATPDITQFNGTLPFFECQQYVANCVQANTQNSELQSQCLSIKCGGKDPADALAAIQSSQSMADSPPPTTSSSMPTTSSSSASAPPTSTGAAAMNRVHGQGSALGVIAAGALAVLAL